MYYADRVKKEYPGYDVRVSILGHLQRVVLRVPMTVYWQAGWVKPQSRP